MRKLGLILLFLVISLVMGAKLNSLAEINITDAILFGLIAIGAIYAANKLSKENPKAEKVLVKR